ncbi:hypothetical protein WR25_01743 isoform C [Diploscapter pachys]|uniref:RRM domain-containing protein n=2 Tax=Diploscapter pachys TaxID=2018661 RepID=A0A2A2J5V5_9BILA|nr:hypothetical protein WR25_01743 isoform A [Diploscapter pachys]PAV57007.1 hypothetical protein WR25_01743 isoform C [Diploscapter pachys]
MSNQDDSYYEGHQDGGGSQSSHPPPKRYRRDETADPTNPNPSIVVHVRNLNPKATEADLLEALATFGPVAYATCMPHSRMALVEFEDLEAARACVNFAATNQIMVAGTPALFNYSTSQQIERIGLECEKPNHILLLAVHNVQYNVTVDTIHEICAPHGPVQRIAIIRKPHILLCLVEFDSIETAKKAKHAMNGADIYSGCCTLKVEFARPNHVRVTRHDMDQRDYTMGIGDDEGYSSNRKTLLPTSGFDAGAGGTGYDPSGTSFRGGGRGRGRGTFPPKISPFHNQSAAAMPTATSPAIPTPGLYNATTAASGIPAYSDPMSAAYASAGAAQSSGVYGYDDPYGSGLAPMSRAGPSHMPQKINQGGQGCVLMLYGIDHNKINCDMLFNILCLYGNVLRISFMRSKSESGILEMGRPQETTNVLGYLQGLELFDLKLEFKPSHQEGVHYLREPFMLPDGTPSFRDYTESRNQRFSTPEMISRNRVVYPTTTLHWYNAPGNMDEEKIRLVRSFISFIKFSTFPTITQF